MTKYDDSPSFKYTKENKMATKINTEKLDFDLAIFKKQKEQLAKVANTEVANRVKEIEKLLAEIKEFVEVSGITVRVRHMLDSAIEEVDALHPDWNSSSYDC